MSEALQQHASSDDHHPRQALVIRPDGIAELVFLGVVHGEELSGSFRGHTWVAHEAHGASEPNEVATAFARSLGWKGRPLLGAVIFTGAPPTLDVPGVVVRQILRLLGDVDLD